MLVFSLILKIEKLIYRPYFKKSIKINKYSIALYKLFLRYCNLLPMLKNINNKYLLWIIKI